MPLPVPGKIAPSTGRNRTMIFITILLGVVAGLTGRTASWNDSRQGVSNGASPSPPPLPDRSRRRVLLDAELAALDRAYDRYQREVIELRTRSQDTVPCVRGLLSPPILTLVDGIRVAHRALVERLEEEADSDDPAWIGTLQRSLDVVGVMTAPYIQLVVNGPLSWLGLGEPGLAGEIRDHVTWVRPHLQALRDRHSRGETWSGHRRIHEVSVRALAEGRLAWLTVDLGKGSRSDDILTWEAMLRMRQISLRGKASSWRSLSLGTRADPTYGIRTAGAVLHFKIELGLLEIVIGADSPQRQRNTADIVDFLLDLRHRGMDPGELDPGLRLSALYEVAWSLLPRDGLEAPPERRNQVYPLVEILSAGQIDAFWNEELKANEHTAARLATALAGTSLGRAFPGTGNAPPSPSSG